MATIKNKKVGRKNNKNKKKIDIVMCQKKNTSVIGFSLQVL